MASTLTRRQQQVHELLRARDAAGEPPPSLDELCRELGLRSRGSLHKHIQALERAGLVEPARGRHRGIRLRSHGLPLLGRIAAGRPIEAVSDPLDVDVPQWLRGVGACYVLEVRGDSMIEDGILDGDRVVVEHRSHAEDGEIVVALIDGAEATLKRIERRGRRIVLHPANAALAPLEFSSEQVLVQGVVVGQMRSYRTRRVPPRER